ncbi:MAG: hypothetical protein AABX01_01690 [Candidatus Micrarchaeota archaeon]
MKIKLTISAIVMLAISLSLNATSASILPIPDEITSIQSPQGVDTENYTVSENQLLAYSKTWGDTQTMWFVINTTSNPGNIFPGLPSGATMPPVRGFATPVSTTFSWTPNFCQSSPTPYSFKVKYYSDGTISQTNVTNISVTNVNRAPYITTNLDIDTPLTPNGKVMVAVGGYLNYNIVATDDDNTQCSENAFLELPLPSMTSWTQLQAASPNILANPDPQTISGQRSFTIGPFDSTQIGSWNLKFSVNDGGTGNNNGTSNMTIVVYQPYGSGCAQTKLSKLNRNNLRYCT